MSSFRQCCGDIASLLISRVVYCRPAGDRPSWAILEGRISEKRPKTGRFVKILKNRVTWSGRRIEPRSGDRGAELMSPPKIECMRCKERKDPRCFCSPWLAIRCWAEANTYLTPPNEHKPSQPVVLCRSCLRILDKKITKKRYNRKPKNKLCNNVRTGIRKSLRTGKPGLWEQRVGYTIAELRRHLESLFKPGMTWQNYGLWHIDHRRPIAMFYFTTIEDPAFRECWALDNLQPLWASDNWAKKKSYESGNW
ncbi:MAG: hypothetical protein CEE38_14475 [Planctomycetes bacterium B3_Pla]|nr:MAG: hypothetical protein CEE38_14475 [Planctomycetes bacterium B3_Pla]